MSGPPIRRALVRCDGAPVPPALAAEPWAVRREITTTGPRADFSLRLEALGGAALKAVGPRAADLVRIASYAYRADQLISRGGTNDAHAARWRRRIALCAPVNDLEFWSGAEVAERLASTLRFLTDDDWAFSFAPAPPDLRQLPLSAQGEGALGRPGSAVLFSGGVDSLCALLEEAAAGGRPVAVGHWSTPAHKKRQLDLLAIIRRRFPGWAFPLVGLPAHGRGGDPPEASQRTRGFLYAALGAAIASEIGVGPVLFGDNGPVSVNLPINDQLVGALASRSTHPKFLHRFNRLVALAFPGGPVVANPLADRTRAEELEVLERTKCADLLPSTLSCAKWRGLPAATPHCGGCSQCVDRRFATVAAGLEAHDPAAGYVHDVFLDEFPAWDAKVTAESYVEFARRVYPKGDDELLDAYPQLYDLAVPGHPDPDGAVQVGVDLAKRHAATVLRALRTVADRHLDALVEGRLPAGCLLRVALGTGAPGAAGPALPAAGPIARGAPVLAQDRLGAEGPEPERAENVFAFEGDAWIVAFAGVRAILRPSEGLTRIAVLLANPGRELTAEEVLAASDPPAPNPMNEAEAKSIGLRPSGYAAGGAKIDRSARDDYRAQVREILKEINEARDEGDGERVAELEERIAWFTKELEGGTGLRGKLRPFPDERSRAHEAVAKSIRRALAALGKAHPTLAEHLKRSLQRTGSLAYRPESRIAWHVRLPFA